MKKIYFILSSLILILCFSFCLNGKYNFASAEVAPKATNMPDINSEYQETVSPSSGRKSHKGQNYTASTPKMSIVIDDFGSYDQSGVDLLLTCPEKLTCAVMPNVDNTEKNIKDIKAHGHEIILHMPMQAHVTLPESWYGPVFIANYDTPETVVQKLDKCLEGFEDVRGLNIHIGSGVGRNRTLMTAIYNYAKEHGLYFLDSRTIETTATMQACKDTNSIYLGRDVFLEADKNRSYAGVKFRLLEGAKIAKEKGSAIVIGHVGAEGGENTAKAILDTIGEIKEMGVKIVPLSEIYDDMKNAGVMSNM